MAEGDEKNAQHTLSVAIALAPASDRALRLMRLSNLQFRSGDFAASARSLEQVNTAQLRPEEREIYAALRERSP